MPVLLALILAAKTARARHKKQDHINDSNVIKPKSSNKMYDSSVNGSLHTLKQSTRKKSKMEKRGAYALDTKHGRISLPPESTNVLQSSSQSTPIADTSLAGSPRANNDSHTATSCATNVLDHTNNIALSSQEINSTIMGLSSPVDLDGVNASFETGTMTDNDNTRGVNGVGNGNSGGLGSTFRNDIRNAWVDAMFGVDFFPLSNNCDRNGSNDEMWRNLSVKQGIGGAGIGSWVTYGALLDPTSTVTTSAVDRNANGGNNRNKVQNTPTKTTLHRDSSLSALIKTKSATLMKSNSISNISCGGTLLNAESESILGESTTIHRAKIGATISRIPLGVYVKSISVTSEAFIVGISPGSILIDINGLGLLGESSHRALERLWRYSGNFDDSSSSLKMKRPIQLRFYKDSNIYSVFLIGSNPLEGIEWAPCGNFGLVQRSHGLAAQCGIRRGCLVLGVDGVGLRELDHAGVARALFEKCVEGSNSVIVTCGYTPATSRSGYYEEKTIEKKSGGTGVEGRPKPVEYSTALSETFFACTTPSMTLVDEGGTKTPNSAIRGSDKGIERNGEKLIASELAAYVATGGILPTDLAMVASQLSLYESPQQQRRRIAGNGTFGPCPVFKIESFLNAWDPFVSLAQSMSYQAFGCCESTYMEIGGPFRTSWDNQDYWNTSAHSTSECVHVIDGIAHHPMPGVAEQVFNAHLMQLLGVSISALMKKDDAPEGQTLMNILIDVALNDVTLCQRLYFLLRCFIEVSDSQRSNEAAKSLELLRYAQRRLSGRMFDKAEYHDANRYCSEGYPMTRESSSTMSFKKVPPLDIAPSESSLEICDVARPGVPVNSERSSNYRSQEATFSTQSLRLDQSDSGDCLLIDNLSSQKSASTGITNGGTKKKPKSSIKIRRLLKGRSKSAKKSSNSQVQPNTGPIRTSKSGSSFSFTNVFHRQSSQLQDDALPSCSLKAPIIMPLSMSQKFENLAWILRRIDTMCSTVEKKLVKSFSQKMADIALRPWSVNKESALASITQNFRSELCRINSGSDSHFPILNPIDPLEQLTSIDVDECFILPSAHFPMLLCFNSSISPSSMTRRMIASDDGRFNTLYRTTVEILKLRSSLPLSQKANGSGEVYIVHGAVGGAVKESGASELYINPKRPIEREVISHRWTKSNILTFETSSNSGYPKALSLKLSTVSRNIDTRDDINMFDDDMGCAFVDLTPIWKKVNASSNNPSVNCSTEVYLFNESEELFDQHGTNERSSDEVKVEIQIKISVGVVPAASHPQKRLLLYKHGDDLRQELLSIQFIERCNEILLASGLDLKLKTFRCLPVGSQKGFIEWVSGTVPLSQICQSTCSSGSNVGSRQSSLSKESTHIDESVHSIDMASQGRSWCKYRAIRGLSQKSNGSTRYNPVQDFLRSAAYDKHAPYYVKKEVMDTFVKSCAGYCVITYLLGVGDRHLDNLLLHETGYLLHCDFSFILGQDPKTYLPMRITDEMIQGFGGQESDNYAKFLSFTGAAFLTLRRHSNLHFLLSQIRNVVYANIRDLSLAQPPTDAILAMRGRFRLDLNDDEALSYIEDVVQKSITSKMWRAVDAIHSLGKRF